MLHPCFFFWFVFFHVQLSVGADPQKTKRNFRGCLENLLYNGLNMLESAKSDSGNQVTLVVSIYERESLPRSRELLSIIASCGSVETTSVIWREFMNKNAC